AVGLAAARPLPRPRPRRRDDPRLRAPGTRSRPVARWSQPPARGTCGQPPAPGVERLLGRDGSRRDPCRAARAAPAEPREPAARRRRPDRAAAPGARHLAPQPAGGARRAVAADPGTDRRPGRRTGQLGPMTRRRGGGARVSEGLPMVRSFSSWGEAVRWLASGVSGTADGEVVFVVG